MPIIATAAWSIPKKVADRFAQKSEAFLEDIAPLGEKRGPLLCQLPPTLVFGIDALEPAFNTIRNVNDRPIVIEVGHKSWASAEALDLLKSYAIDRVLADPAPVWPEEDFETKPKYVHLHGKPKIYYSSYTDDEIRSFSKLLTSGGWCAFDNTASGAAIGNALTMLELN